MVTKFIPKDQETGVEDAAVRNNLLLPSVSCLHFGFWILRLVPTPTSIGLRFVFPFKYLHRLHYESMIGPALVYPRVPHRPWTYEPHAQGRTLRSTFSYFGLGIYFVFTSGFAYFFYICLGTPSVFILGSCIFLQNWF